MCIFRVGQHLHLDFITNLLPGNILAWVQRIAAWKGPIEKPFKENQASTNRLDHRGWCHLRSPLKGYTSTRTEANKGGARILLWLFRWRWLCDNGGGQRTLSSSGPSKYKQCSYSVKVSQCIRWWCLCKWPAHWFFPNESELASDRQVCISCGWADGHGAIHEAKPA